MDALTSSMNFLGIRFPAQILQGIQKGPLLMAQVALRALKVPESTTSKTGREDES